MYVEKNNGIQTLTAKTIQFKIRYPYEDFSGLILAFVKMNRLIDRQTYLLSF